MALRTMFQHVVRTCSSPLPVLTANSVRAMSAFVNNVELLGRVGREPQKIGTNDAVAFPLYTESVVKLQDGTVKTYPCWHKVLVTKKELANIVIEALERGQRCYVSGRVAYRAAEPSADGRMVYNHQAAVIARRVIFLEKSRKRQAEQAEQAANSGDASSQAAASIS
ncbi:single-stranded DNA-binding protein, mitochondrial [Frankliniella occidentalis]|uniref:Single-stranded DNA-binding protein, mitochondrial n=1 Tax=Frankliniella occidentalis TaxID=133901 RepID=A0A6J1SMW4_FRAOC|nr:single-stranded DNA-binding protein, mitochondrial [Frankliniella occidentalis]